MQLHNSAVLITGGSQGLGRSLALACAERGARVVIVARGQTALAQTVEAVRARGGQAFGITADVGDKHATHRIAAEATALVGPIDVLIHNASSLGPTPLRPLLDMDCEDVERVLAVNVVGPFRLTKALAGGMLLRQRGVIVHVSSDAAVSAYPQWGAYSASKAALDQLGRVLAAELQGQGVRVLSVDPGEMDTAMHHDAMPDADRSLLRSPASVATRVIECVMDASAAANGARVVV